MEYRNLGKSGLRISALSLGSWVTFHEQIGEKIAYECMKTAFDFGVNFFDNAEVYAAGEAEKIMGNVIKKAAWKRSDLIISTKIYWGGKGQNDTGLSRKHIFEGTDASLKRLGMEYVDLIYCHRPDLFTPIEETVWAMNHILQQGKALYWGTSEWSAIQIQEAYNIARREHLIPPIMEQPEYNMFKRQKVEEEYKSLYSKIGLGTTTFSPLASGFLTGKYNNEIPENSRFNLENYAWLRNILNSDEGKSRINKVKKLTQIADSLGITMAQFAIAWCLLNKNVSSVITGASKPEQVESNLKSINFVNLITPEIVEQIELVLENKPAAEHNWRKIQ
ncbi:MAG: voltage-dependent potassium channel subunit beta [Ignavibacteria bacterium]|nr:voltage-dependent potassium channel subunit beta [Ignavibacteria bacterium]